ncbi:MAG: amino acid adenylation domain-containing protein, partial [Myxococcota bacterium]
GEQTKTYRDLVDAVAARAAHMANVGVRSGDRIAIAAEPGFALVEAVLAVLRLGATCVPLDPSQPSGRRDRILASARPAAVLATSMFVDAFKQQAEPGGRRHGMPILNLDAPAPCAPSEAGLVAYAPERPAYVLYTSGSTGEPKGVVLPIDTLSRLVAWQNERSGPKACAVTLALAPFGFDVAFQELLSTLVAGGCLVLVDRVIRRDPGAILDRIDAHRVTRLFAPFVLLDAIARTAEFRERALATLREVVTAGEALRITPPIRAFFERLAPQAVLDNQYGPTEAHVVSAHRLEGNPSVWPELPPIGRALPGTRLDVRDRWGRRLPDGVAGELYIGGRGLAHGYLGAPARTAERFVPDATVAVSCGDSTAADGAKRQMLSTRAYRTGDLVRRQPDGTIDFVGRIDDQVKVRGFRVELGEIEAVLARHPAVKAAVASIRRTSDASDSKSNGGRLVAHIVASEDASSSDAELQAWLQNELPPYMMPEALVRISALPLTVNGKVDRRALPAPAQIRFQGATIEPRTETERLVAELWGRVLEREGVGAHDNFFDLGGHSLTAVRAATMLGTAIGREVPVTHIFEHPTPAKLGARLEAKTQDAPEATAPSRQDFSEARPLSEAQRRLFVLNKHCPPTHRFYHTVTARRLKGVLNEAALRAALDGIVVRHEPLRTAFEIESLDPIDVKKSVRPARAVPIEIIDLTQESVSDQERAVRVRSNADFELPFELSSGLLIRTTLFRLAIDHHVLVIVCHQLAFDAWSREVLLRELEHGYREALQRGPKAMQGETAPPETEVRYDDLVVHEAERQTSEAARARFEAARRRFSEPCDPLAFETDHSRPDIKSFAGLILPLRIPPGLVAQVRTLAQTAGVTLYMALFSLYAVWLHAYSRQEQFRIGSSTARRRGKAAETLIGPFNDFLVLPVDLSGDPSFRTLMTRVRRVALDAHAHGDVPFASLVETLDADRDASRTPLFQAMFTYKRFLERPEGRLGDLAVEGLHVDWQTGRTDLTLSLLDDGESIVGFLEASADLFDRGRMMVRLRHA